MPRKKVSSKEQENNDDSQASDSQNSQTEFNVEDLEKTKGQVMVNALKGAIKHINDIYNSPQKVVDDDLLDKLIKLMKDNNDNKDVDRLLVMCFAMIMSCNIEKEKYPVIFKYVIENLTAFDNDKKNIRQFQDLIEYLTVATTKIQLIALEEKLLDNTSLINQFVIKLYELMSLRVSDNDKMKISELLKTLFSKLYMLNDPMLIFVISRYYEALCMEDSSVLIYFYNPIMEGIIQRHKQILADVLVGVYIGKMELDISDNEMEEEEEGEEEEEEEEEDDDDDEENGKEKDEIEEEDNNNENSIENGKENGEEEGDDDNEDISNNAIQMRRFQEAQMFKTKIDIILKMVEISQDVGLSILPQLNLISLETKIRLHELAIIIKIITLCKSIKSSNENSLNRFYTDQNEEIRLAMCKQCSAFLLNNNNNLKPEIKNCLNERLNDVSPIVRRSAFETLCNICARNPTLFNDDELNNMTLHMLDKDDLLQRLAITGLSNIYKKNISEILIANDSFQLSSLKKEYNQIKRFLIIPNNMFKLFLCKDVMDVVLRSIQENILPAAESVSNRTKVMIGMYIELDEENRNLFIKLIKHKYQGKKLFIDFLNERKNGKISEVTLVKFKAVFNLTVTQIRKLEKSNNKKLNELLNNLISDSISYEDAYKSFHDLTRDKTWNNPCYITIYSMIGEFIVNKEECIFTEILSSEDILLKNYDVILSFLFDIASIEAKIFPISCIDLLFEFVEDSKENKRVNLILKLLAKIIESNSDIDKSTIKTYKNRLLQFAKSSDYKDKSLIKYSSILLLHPPFFASDDAFVKGLLDVNQYNMNNPNLESNLISLRMLVQYQCKYFTNKSKCKAIIKTINENLLKNDETDKPTRTIRRSIIIKYLVIKLYGMFLWKYEGDKKEFPIYYENIIAYLYQVMRYKGNIVKSENILSQSEKNLLFYTAIFQTIKAARKFVVAQYIENKVDIYVDLCYFIQLDDENFQWKYLEKVHQSVNKYALHYPFFIIYALTVNEKRQFASKAFEYFNEGVIQQRIIYDKMYGESSSKETNPNTATGIVIQNRYDDQSRYSSLVEYDFVYLIYVIANDKSLEPEPKQCNYEDQQNYIHFCIDGIVDKNGDNADFIGKILDRMLFCKDKKNPDNNYLAIFTSLALRLLEKKTANYKVRLYDGPIYLPNSLFIKTDKKIDCVIHANEIEMKKTPRKSSTPGSVYRSRVTSSVKTMNKTLSNSTTNTPVSSVKSKELLSSSTTSTTSTTNGRRKTNSRKDIQPRKLNFDVVVDDKQNQKKKKEKVNVVVEEEEEDDDEELPPLYPEDEDEGNNENNNEEEEEEEEIIKTKKKSNTNNKKTISQKVENGKKETKKKDYKKKKGSKRQKVEEYSDDERKEENEEEEEENEVHEDELPEKPKITAKTNNSKHTPPKQKKITSFTPSKRKGKEMMEEESEDDDNDVLVPSKRKISEVKSTPKTKKTPPKKVTSIKSNENAKSVTPRKLYSEKKTNTKINSFRVKRKK